MMELFRWQPAARLLAMRLEHVRGGIAVVRPAGGIAAALAAVLYLSGCAAAIDPPQPSALVGSLPESRAWTASVVQTQHGDRAALAKLASGVPADSMFPIEPSGSASTAALPKGGGYYKVGKPYLINGVQYTPRHDPEYSEEGIASWYGPGFHGKRTANGEVYDMHALSAAHRTMPLPSFAYVTNLENGRRVMVRVNDRGPFKKGRIIDVSARVAKELDFHADGVARVKVEYAGKAPLDGSDHKEQAFLEQSRRP